MIKTYNLKTDEVQEFDEETSPEWAVAFAYCEQNNRLSWLYRYQQKNELTKAYALLPMRTGPRSVACGDWSCVLS